MQSTNESIKHSAWRALLLAPLALLLGMAVEARAANLDEALLKAAPEILKELKGSKANPRNIGVLPFKVQKGTRKPSYVAAPLSATLTGRLENALIMSQGSNEAIAIGIIRDAAATASKAKIGSYLSNPIAFRRLFKTSYPLAWGNKKVKPDVFLTGIVTSTGDRSITKIQLQRLTPESRQGGAVKLENVGEVIKVPTDRSLLRDLGYPVVLPRSVLAGGVTAKKRDKLALARFARRGPGQQKDADVTPDDIAGMAFELVYNGEKQELTPLGEGQDTKGQYTAPVIPAGTALTMALTRLSEEAGNLGVVVRVNGMSALQFEEGEPIKCRKWIYEPAMKGQRDVYEGFYSEKAGSEKFSVTKFQIMTGKDAKEAFKEMGNRAGWIDIDVFASGEPADKKVATDKTQSKQQQTTDAPEMKMSIRGARARGLTSLSLKELQNRLRKAAGVKAKKNGLNERGLILVENEPSGEVDVSTSDLPNPIHLGGISIRYYDSKEPDND